MAQRRTVNFLPEIFQTETNKKLLAATFDQLTQEPKFKRTQGFIGRQSGPGISTQEGYVVEPNKVRQDYQLEPGVIFLQPDTQTPIDAITYPGLIDTIDTAGGDVTRPDRLFASQSYGWDPFVDFDKFTNFSQYYWLPAGPDPVDVSGSVVPLTDSYTVTRGSRGYTFTGQPTDNPTLILVRGGNYTFDLNQSGIANFWIQTAPGISGTLPQSPNQTSRDVYGVVNNGASSGTLTFNVPRKGDQDFFYNMTEVPAVDLATNLKFNQVNNVFLQDLVDQYGGIDGITDLNNRTIIFLDRDTSAESGGWYLGTTYDPLIRTRPINDPDPLDGQLGSFDQGSFDQTQELTTLAERYSVWQIQYVYDAEGENPYLQLSQLRTVPNLTKFPILFGATWSNRFIYKDAGGQFAELPSLTAAQDRLYYQDSRDPNLFGIIDLVTEEGQQIIDVDDILGRANYISPNGVTFTNGLKVQFRGRVIPSSYTNQQYYVEGVGTAIRLLPVGDFVTPETYTEDQQEPYDSAGFDENPYDQGLNQPLVPDYITINRASQDLNAWARSNRWFHIDVITATANYNDTIAVLDNDFRAKRPILEFYPNLRLWNMGTQGKQPVDIIDFEETDAFSNINGAAYYEVDGYEFIAGTRVIFAADIDPQVKNKVYEVQIIDPDADGSKIINLVPTSDTNVHQDQCVVVLSGLTLQGKTYRFNEDNWRLAQEKTSVNQSPLFDIFDQNGISLGDRDVYVSSNFEGNRLFGYAIGAGPEDPVLGFALRYLSINNVGDIVFTSDLYQDGFVYVDNNISVEQKVSIGFVRQYYTRTLFDLLLGWRPLVTDIQSVQVFNITYEVGMTVRVDVVPRTDLPVPAVRVSIDSVFQDPSTYTYSVDTTRKITTFTFDTQPVPGGVIAIEVISSDPSQQGYYSVPANLENNPFNENPIEFTLGTIRNHYNTIGQNLLDIQGDINGPNNTRDLGNLVKYGRNIVQNSAPVSMMGAFMRQGYTDLLSSIEYSSREYEKFKNIMLTTYFRNEYNLNMTVPEILDSILTDMNTGKNEQNPFYWTDMLPSGAEFEATTYTVTPITTPTFDTLYTYDFTEANYRAVTVYLNDEQLVKDQDYVVASDGPRLTILVPLAIGDQVVIREYATTYGSYCPATPTKLGLYDKYEPAIFEDNSYIQPQTVIRGHDGSITVAFGDTRDDILLEFEKRVYNNLKVDTATPLPVVDVMPGQFRDTGYSLAEINQLLAPSFLGWVAWNKVDYITQQYDANNGFTYNYSSANSKLDSSVLLGGWRGIYNYYYDTDTPHTMPWQLLGFTIKPTWWEDAYGPAPYTSGNLVLWQDLEDGRVRDPAGFYILPQYRRPGLTQVIPVDSEGNLLTPLDCVVKNYDFTQFRKSWVFGDDGPAENAWRSSSAYPFALQKLLVLTRPAKYYALLADRDLYKRDAALDQILYEQRYRLNPADIVVYGDGTAKHSYINFIVDYNQQRGIDSQQMITSLLDNLDVRLCYRMAAFTDKKYLKLFAEKSSPDSQNASLLLPDESYNLLLYRNQAFGEIAYSSVMIQQTDTGYAVFGNSLTEPYFEILQSVPNGNYDIINYGEQRIRLARDFLPQTIKVPYGYEFVNQQSVADFLHSYGQFLTQSGMIFDTNANGYQLDWRQMIVEFLNWSEQSWEPGTVINLNPAAQTLQLVRPLAVVKNLIEDREPALLNQNRQPIEPRNYVIDRIDNQFAIRMLANDTIGFARLQFTSYEHLLVLDNVSVFADLIYRPATGSRQQRIKLVGGTTFEWNGQLDAQGFILNQNNIREWLPNQKYTKGQIVLYKNQYWSAAQVIEPKEKFDFSEWIQSDYANIDKGLLPNLATKAQQMTLYYDNKNGNLERDADLLGFGLTGFRPREYMASLNLDDVSQVNLYSSFLKNKGTRQTVEIFERANLGKELADYDVYENWAIRRAIYGANANRSYFELQLQESLLDANPSVVAIVQPDQEIEANQNVLLSQLYKKSVNYTSTNILPVTYDPDITNGLPSAGYVNIDDIDIQSFDFDSLTNTLNINDVIQGTTIWLARVNDHTWDVFRANLVPVPIVRMDDNLDGRSRVTFLGQHGLAVNDHIIIRFFSSLVNGIYQVREVPDLDSIIIDYSFSGGRTYIAEGDGIVFVLESVRVAQPSDIANFNFVETLSFGDRVWVDNNGSGHWSVIEKTAPFEDGQTLIPLLSEVNQQFGAGLAQTQDNLVAMIGSPGHGSGQGCVYNFAKTSATEYIEKSFVTMAGWDTGDSSGPQIYGFGHDIAIGRFNWAIVGAPSSSISTGAAAILYRPSSEVEFVPTQLFDYTSGSADDQFGYSVAMSQDERWAYVGAPGANRVFAFQKIDLQAQAVTYSADGSSTDFSFEDAIVIADATTQLTVTIDGVSQDYGVDYTVSGTDVEFTTAPAADSRIVIARKIETTAVGDGSTDVFDISDLYTAISADSVRVSIDDVNLRANVDYTMSTPGQITFTTPPTNTADIRFTAISYFQQVGSAITVAGLAADARFGHSVACTTDGRQIIIGAPGYNNDQGRIYVFDRSVEKTVITGTAGPAVINTLRPITGTAQVFRNGTELLDSDYYVGGSYTIDSSGDVDISITLAVGDAIEVATNAFRQVQAMDSRYITNYGSTTDQYIFSRFAKFGWSVDQCPTNCSVYVGAPENSVTGPSHGSAERFVNQARIYGTVTSTSTVTSVTAGNSIRINGINIQFSGITLNSVVNDINTAANLALRGSGYLGLSNVIAANVDGKLRISLIDSAAGTFLNKLQVLPGLSQTSDAGFTQLNLQPYVWTQTISCPVPTDYGLFGTRVFVDTEADNLVISAPRGTLVHPSSWTDDGTTFDAGGTTFFDTVTQSGTVFTFDYLTSASDSVDDPGQFAYGQQVYSSDVVSLDQFGSNVNYVNGVLLISATGTEDGSTSDVGAVYRFDNPTRQPGWQVVRSQQPVVESALLNTAFLYDRTAEQVRQYLDWIDPLRGRILGPCSQNIDYISAVDPAAYNTGSVNNYGATWRQEYVGRIWWNTSRARFYDYDQGTPIYSSRIWGQVFPGSSVDVYQWIESTEPPGAYTGPGIPWSVISYSTSARLNDAGTFEPLFYFWVTGLDVVASAAGKTLSTNVISRYIENPRSSGIPYLAALRSNVLALYNSTEYLQSGDTILHVEYDQIKNDAPVHVEYELVPENKRDGFVSEGIYRKLLDSFCGADIVGNTVPDPNLSLANQYGINFRPRQSMFVDRFTALENYLERVNSVLARFPISEIRSFSLLNAKEPEPVPNDPIKSWDKRVADLTELGYQNIAAAATGYRWLVASDSNNLGRWTIYEKVSPTADTASELSLQIVQNYDTTEYWQYIDWYAPGYTASDKPVAEVPVVADLDSLTVVPGTIVKVTANAQGRWELYVFTLAEGWIRIGLELGTIAIDADIWDYEIGRFGFDVEVFDTQYYDQEPTVETRYIIRAINEELLIGELLIERNRALTLMFDYVLSEQLAPDWLFKTSLVDVDHIIRDLVPYQTYRRDNQDFVLDYIKEVKPYHVQIREFNLRYNGFDQYRGSMTDFDLPAFYDLSQKAFVSPILDNNFQTNSSFPDSSEIWQEFPYDQWYQNYRLEIGTVVLVNGGSGYSAEPTVEVTGTCVRPASFRARINANGQVVAVDILDSGEGYTTNALLTFVGGNGTGAQATAYMVNPLVRSLKTTIKYDRYQYNTTVTPWLATVPYDNGRLVRNQDRVYVSDCAISIKMTFSNGSISVFNIQASDLEDYGYLIDATLGLIVTTVVTRNNAAYTNFTLQYVSPVKTLVQFTEAINDSTTGSAEFDPTQWSIVDAATLSGVDRTMGLYAPTVNEPGLQLSLLITGIEYPGVQVRGLSWPQPGEPSAPSLALDYQVQLDAIYESSYADVYLGTRPTDINVDGAAYVDTYNSHAPEELIPGATFDTLDLRVYTRPGADWTGLGHGWPSDAIIYEVSDTQIYSFAQSSVKVPVTISVKQVNAGITLYEGTQYTIDWENRTVEFIAPISNGNFVEITVDGFGGGNQLFRQSIMGSDIPNDGLVLDVTFDEVQSIVIYRNGHPFTDFTYEALGNYQTIVEFGTISDGDYFAMVVMGFQTPQYAVSVPYTEVFVFDGTDRFFDVVQTLGGTNPVNCVVELNGQRLRPPSGVEYTADGLTTVFETDPTAEIDPASIASNEVMVFVDQVPLILGSEYVVDAWDGSSANRTVTLAQAPAAGTVVQIAVTTVSEYRFSSNILQIRSGVSMTVGDRVAITAYGDTRQQRLLTRVYVGPTESSAPTTIPFDSLPYDVGGFSEEGTVPVSVQDFDLGRSGVVTSKTLVTLNQLYLSPNNDYVVFQSDGTSILRLYQDAIASTDVIAVTMHTDQEVPDAIAFRVFEDMRDNRGIYRMNDQSTTRLTQPLLKTQDVIHVEDASLLSEPSLDRAVFGTVTINGERITYRTRNTVNNTLSGLRRGVLGTAAANHGVDALVYDIGQVNLLPQIYQDQTVSGTSLADGSTSSFTFPEIELAASTPTAAVTVSVGGVVLDSGYSVTSIAPVSITLSVTPPAGVDVAASVLQGRLFYQPGLTTPSDGVPLQETNTDAARFIRS